MSCWMLFVWPTSISCSRSSKNVNSKWFTCSVNGVLASSLRWSLWLSPTVSSWIDLRWVLSRYVFLLGGCSHRYSLVVRPRCDALSRRFYRRLPRLSTNVISHRLICKSISKMFPFVLKVQTPITWRLSLHKYSWSWENRRTHNIRLNQFLWKLINSFQETVAQSLFPISPGPTPMNQMLHFCHTITQDPHYGMLSVELKAWLMDRLRESAPRRGPAHPALPNPTGS